MMINWEAELNREQREAVFTTEGPLVVLAGAGSGKTRVIAYRTAYLIEEKGVPLDNILAVTFTNKAAREMRERVGTLLRHPCREMWVGTFHSVCARLLRAECHWLGFRPDFVIMDEDDQDKVIKEAQRRLAFSQGWEKPQVLREWISGVKNQMITPAEYEKNFTRLPKEKDFARLYRKYQDILKENNAFDFDDLLLSTVQIFKSQPQVLEQYRKRLRFVMADEFQDINLPQYEFIKLLSLEHKNICVVGDDYQAIFSWRGADVRFLLDRFAQDFPQAKVIKLERNYRSGPLILDAANELIASLTRGHTKKLWTEKPDAQRPLVRYEASDEIDEARFVVQEMEKLVTEESHAWEDFAILYRMNSQSRVMEETLLARAIPYRVVGGPRFYERKEIKDAIALLRFAINPQDSVSLRRILAWMGGIGPVTCAKAEDLGPFLYQGLRRMAEKDGIKGRGREVFKRIEKLLSSFPPMREEKPPRELLEKLLLDSGYFSLLENEATLEAQNRAENLKELLNLAAQFQEENPGASIEEFLAHVALYTDLDSLEERPGGVTLMTVHSAKGLEFPVVFIIGLEEGIFPHYRAMSQSEMDEEKRLCYVAITRAEKRVYFSWARRRFSYGARVTSQRSSFLDEIPEDLFFEESTKTSVQLMKGQRVFHATWGEGEVKDWQGEGEELILEVVFPRVGKKRLMLQYAPLRFLD